MKNEEDAFIRRALAGAEKAERLSRIKEIVATVLAFGAVLWLTERSSKPELRPEPLLIGAGLIAAVCTAKIKRLINENTRVILHAISDLHRG